MTSSGTIPVKAGCQWGAILLFICFLSLLMATPAHAQSGSDPALEVRTTGPGKGPLTQGSDYSLNYNASFNCQLDMTMLTAAGTIGPNQRLIIRYRTQLDPNTQNGSTLTNIAGAVQWFDADSNVAGRKTFTASLSDGTTGSADNQDAVTVSVALSGYQF